MVAFRCVKVIGKRHGCKDEGRRVAPRYHAGVAYERMPPILAPRERERERERERNVRVRTCPLASR